MIGHIRMHGPNDAQFVGHRRDMGKNFADVQAALAMLAEGKGRFVGPVGRSVER